MDPDYNQSFYRNFIFQLNRKYKTYSLNELTSYVFQGVGRNLIDISDFTLLKVKNIKQGNEIDFKDVEFIKTVPSNKLLIENDIISPFIGEAIKQIKFSVFSKKEKGFFTVDNNVGVIRVEQNKNNAVYICEVLNSIVAKSQIFKLIGGGGVPFLGVSNAKKIQIPMPPIEKQNEIALYISEIRQKAKSLQTEATNILENAKKEVEQMILG